MPQQQGAYFGSGAPSTEILTSLPYPGLLGMVCEVNEATVLGAAPKWVKYRLVKLAAGQTALKGQVVIWSDKTAFTVAVTATKTSRGQVCGVVPLAVATAGAYFWMIVKGRKRCLIEGSPTSASSAVGKPVIPGSTTDGSVDVLALSTAPKVRLIGACFSTTDGDGLIDVDINLEP